MRNKLTLLAIILPLVVACGIGERLEKAVTDAGSNSNANILVANTNTNKSLTDQAVDTAVGGQKVGIAECDEAIDVLSAQAENPDDNFVTKAIKKTALNTFRDQLKTRLEQNQANTKEVAKFCREFRDNLQKSLSNQNSNTSAEKGW